MLIPALLLTLALSADDSTVPYDVVELITTGEEAAGSADFDVERFGYTYHFTSAANRDAFLADPLRFEVQCGGACARMGPLSGLGKPDIYTVHAGRLYFFASESCRKGFLEAPDQLLDQPEPVPKVTQKQLHHGASLMNRVVEGLGGPSAVDGALSLRFVRETFAPVTGELDFRETRTVRFPADHVKESHYPGYPTYVMASTRSGSWANEAPLHPLRRRAFVRGQMDHPLLLARARKDDGHVAYPDGTAEHDGKLLDLLRIHFLGRSTVLGIDRESGRVLTLATNGRGPQLTVGPTRIVYGGFERVGDLTLPHHEQRWFEDVELTARTWKVEVDPDLDAALFRQPSKADDDE